jgi:hypothetical protein
MLIMKKLLLTLLISSILITMAHTCYCPRTTLIKQYHSALRIFDGTVTSVSLSDTESNNMIHFTVNEVWKGSSTDELNISTCIDPSCCRFNFEIGKRYIVFTYMSEGLESTNSCTGTTIFRNTIARKLDRLSSAEDRG